MATYAELNALFSDATMIARTKFALLVGARMLRQESPSTPNHANRVLFASRVYSGSLQKVSINHVMMEVLTDPTVAAAGAAATDAQIFNAIATSADFLISMETN
jgi:hypothetical protein